MPFSKILGGIKSFASNAAENIKQGAIKHGPTILDMASKSARVAGALGVPGASVIGEGLDVAKNLVKGVPNDEAKEKLDNFISDSKTESKKISEDSPGSAAPHIINAFRSGAKYYRKKYGKRSHNPSHDPYYSKPLQTIM
jgi:hypothetical protein